MHFRQTADGFQVPPGSVTHGQGPCFQGSTNILRIQSLLGQRGQRITSALVKEEGEREAFFCRVIYPQSSHSMFWA